MAGLARIERNPALTTVASQVDVACMRETYRRTREDGGGVDGMTAAQYEAGLEANLASLLERFRSGRSPLVRRMCIPNPGKGREDAASGIPTLENKILQWAVPMALAPIFEQEVPVL